MLADSGERKAIMDKLDYIYHAIARRLSIMVDCVTVEMVLVAL